MQSSLIKQRLRVPYYRWQIVAVFLYFILAVMNLFMPTRSSIRLIADWNMFLYPILLVQFGMNVISYLDLSARGLVMRRGWQRFEVNWAQIESFGIGTIGRRRYLPYIILHQPIKGLPRVKLKELTPEQQQRTLTLEGWDNPEIIAKALHASLASTTDQWQVTPDFSKSLKFFYSYQKMIAWATLVVILIFVYLSFL
ncbi:hypothetical protein [Herpetosiphon gulosus]|uniref:PH domain-containing protein n=1 Tax=Herpetosiphon gulosus TaxID=1973496 RepID=A0ABP9X149_9CHLR